MSLAVAFILPPTYRASTVLVSANTDRGGLSSLASSLGQFSGLASLAGINLGNGGSQTEEVLAVLRSREFIERFISEKGLLPILYSKSWDSVRLEWRVPEKKQPTLGKAYRYFYNKVLTIVQDKKTGLVTLQIFWKDRGQAAEWANELVNRINLEMRSRAIRESEASLMYLQNELDKTSEVSIREAINKLIETQVKQRMLANVTQEYAFRVAERATVPERDERYSPKRLMIVSLGILMGLALGILSVLVSEWFLVSENPYDAK